MPKEIAYLPQAALDRMQSDLMAHGDVTRAQLADRILEDASPLASYTILDLMNTSEDDSIRLNAAKYLLDRANGKPKASLTVNSTPTNPVLQILEGVVVERPTPPGQTANPPMDYTQDATVIDQTTDDPTPDDQED